MTVLQLIEVLQQLPPHYLVVHNDIDTGDIQYFDFVELDHDGSSPAVSVCFVDDQFLSLTNMPPTEDGWYWYQENENCDFEPVQIWSDETSGDCFCFRCGDDLCKSLSEVKGKWSKKPLATPMSQR